MLSLRFAGLVFPALLTACSSPDTESNSTNLLLRNDFDSLAGWTGAESPSLTRERAHSGQYSIKTDKDLEYSLTYVNLLGRLSPVRLTKIKVAAWVFAAKPGNAQLTVQLTRSLQDNTTIFNQSLDLGETVKKPGEWTYVSKVFALPADISSANQLRIFVWRASAAEPVYLDDLVVTNEP